MCGRFAQFGGHKLTEHFQAIDEAPELPFTYNAAPNSKIRVFVKKEGRILTPMKWWLEFPWSVGKDYKMFNTTTEKLQTTFKNQFHGMRCIIPVNGFYEWADIGKQKFPHYFHPADNTYFALAGIFNRYRPENGTDEVVTCSIITTVANTMVSKIHVKNRMAVILPERTLGYLAGQ